MPDARSRVAVPPARAPRERHPALLGLLAFVTYLVVFILGYAWDLALHPGLPVGQRTVDPNFYLWSYQWWPYALTHGLNPLYSTQIGAPDGVSLAWATTSPPLALVMWPVTATLGPVVSVNVTLLLMPPLAAWAAFLAMRRLTGRFWPALLAGTLYGFSPYELQHSVSVLPNLTAIALFPLMIYLVLLWRDGSLRRGAFIAWLAVAMAVEFYLFAEAFVMMTMMGVVALGLALALAGRGRRRTVARLIAYIAIAYAFALVLASPLLLYMLTHEPETFSRQMPVFSVRPIGMILPRAHRIPAGSLRSFAGHNLTINSITAFVGVPALLMLIIMAATTRRNRASRRTRPDQPGSADQQAPPSQAGQQARTDRQDRTDRQNRPSRRGWPRRRDRHREQDQPGSLVGSQPPADPAESVAAAGQQQEAGQQEQAAPASPDAVRADPGGAGEAGGGSGDEAGPDKIGTGRDTTSGDEAGADTSGTIGWDAIRRGATSTGESSAGEHGTGDFQADDPNADDPPGSEIRGDELGGDGRGDETGGGGISPDEVGPAWSSPAQVRRLQPGQTRQARLRRVQAVRLRAAQERAARSYLWVHSGRLTALVVITFVVAALLSFGPDLQYGPVLTTSSFPLPWGFIWGLPFLTSAEPTRIMLFGYLALTVALALWLARPAGGWALRLRWGLAALVLAAILGNLPTFAAVENEQPYPDKDPKQAVSQVAESRLPDFISAGRYRQALQPGEIVVVVSRRGNAGLLFQAASDFYFRIDGGFINASQSKPWAIPDAVELLAHPSRERETDFWSYVKQQHVGAIIVEDSWSEPWMTIFARMGMKGTEDGGVIVYPVACPSGTTLIEGRVCGSA